LSKTTETSRIMGAWCRRLATRGLCVGPDNAGVASRPEDAGELNRREAIESEI